MLGAFPVDRDAPKPSALKIPLEILRASGLVVVFAGGTRSIEPGEIKRGAATLAVLAGCAIVPVRYSGPSRLRLRDLLRRPPETVDFLPPVHPDPVARNQDGIRREARRLSQALESPPHGPGAESAG